MSKLQCTTMSDAEMKKREEQWRAEEDARTMAQYQEILNDKARLRRAIKQANEEAKKMQQRADAMSRAAKTGNIKEGK